MKKTASSEIRRWRPSVTVAAVIERDGEFLFVEETTRDGIRLNNPAGHLESGESLVQACMREVREETAWEFTPTALIGIYMTRFTRTRSEDDVTYLRFAFTGTLGRHYHQQRLDDGILRTLWMGPKEVRANAEILRNPLVIQCLDDYLAGRRIPLQTLHTSPSVFGLPTFA